MPGVGEFFRNMANRASNFLTGGKRRGLNQLPSSLNISSNTSKLFKNSGGGTNRINKLPQSFRK